LGKDELGNVYMAVCEDKELNINADINKEYLVDYYYEYGKKALIYAI